MQQRLYMTYKTQNIYYLILYRKYLPTSDVKRMTQTDNHHMATTPEVSGTVKSHQWMLWRFNEENTDRPRLSFTPQNKSSAL